MQADLNLRWAYMSKGTFSDVATPMGLCGKKELGTLTNCD